MSIRKFVFLLLSVVLVSCEKETKLEDFVDGTWDLFWKQCGPYFNKHDSKINFTVTDSINSGWFLEEGLDTVFFNFTFVGDENLNLSTTDSLWNGNLKFSEFGNTRLIFQKDNKECTDETYRFE